MVKGEWIRGIMLTLWIHTVAFFQVVVMNCIQPANWQYCYRLDEGLLPDLIDGYEIWTEQKKPYQEEKEFLEKVSGTHDKMQP